MREFIQLDFAPLLTACCCALSCALLGNFLVLRRMSLMGDAISHSVLPGIVIAFLVSSSRASLPVFLGAAGTGILTAVLVDLVRRAGKVESGAAMGVVFSILFALGVLLIEQAAARNIDLDADCVLHGQLEAILWYPPNQFSSWFELVFSLPNETLTSFAVMLFCALFVVLLFKELKISSFDPALSSTLGFSSGLLHYLLMVFVAAAVVASFRAVGSILVISMLICPAASARLLSDRLKLQILTSAMLAIAGTCFGYFLAAFVPIWFGFNSSLNAAGGITISAGFILALSVFFAPQYGVLAKFFRQRSLSLQVGMEDLLGNLFRREESQLAAVNEAALVGGMMSKKSLREAERKGLIMRAQDGLINLTDKGREQARALVRTHRLWEAYFVEELGLRPDHVHDRAMELEHFTSEKLSKELAEAQENPAQDPHGKPIPE